MEKNNLSQIELNIKAIEALGLKVKNYSGGDGNGSAKGISIKDIDNAKKIVAFYFSGFNHKDSDKDLITPGAFTKTIKENFSRFKHFKNHDQTLTPGKILSVEQDEHGAFAVSKLADTTLGKDTLIEYEAEIITEHSMGFGIIKETFDAKTDTNVISEVKLWEMSTLNAWGSNMHTPVIGLKAQKIKETIAAIEKVLSSGDISDEGGKRLEKQLADLIQSFKSAPAIQDDIFKKLAAGLQL